MSEKIIGDLLKDTDKETRKKIYIATKCACHYCSDMAMAVGIDD